MDFNAPIIQKNMKLWPFKVKNKSNQPSIQIEINGKPHFYLPQQISGMILKHLKKIAEDYIGINVCDAVITVPSYFNEKQKVATKEAEQITGLNVLD